MYEIVFTEYYEKKVKKFLKKHKNIKQQYIKTLKFLEIDPFHPSLRLHKLKGELDTFYSISINMEYRIILDFLVIDNKIYLIDIGKHDEVY